MKDNKSSSVPKRFSVVIRNLDFNAYRAYKNVNETDHTKNKNPYELLHGQNNLMRFPFGLTEKRFRWQLSNNIGELWEVQGNMMKRHPKQALNRSTGNLWEDIMDRTEGVEEKSFLNNQ